MELPQYTTPRIWLIDDIALWHEVTQRTLKALGTYHFQGFYQATSALMALDHCQPDEMPNYILMDFFIGEDRGDRVTRHIRELFPELNCTIIGYSTAGSGSRAIVRAGGNEIIPKHQDGKGMNPSLHQWISRFIDKNIQP